MSDTGLSPDAAVRRLLLEIMEDVSYRVVEVGVMD